MYIGLLPGTTAYELPFLAPVPFQPVLSSTFYQELVSISLVSRGALIKPRTSLYRISRRAMLGPTKLIPRTSGEQPLDLLT